MPQKMLHKLTRQDLSTCDPLLQYPEQNIEHNIAKGIDDMIPDPDDVPSGFNANGTQRLDLEEADAQCLVENDLLRIRILALRK